MLYNNLSDLHPVIWTWGSLHFRTPATRD